MPTIKAQVLALADLASDAAGETVGIQPLSTAAFLAVLERGHVAHHYHEIDGPGVVLRAPINGVYHAVVPHKQRHVVRRVGLLWTAAPGLAGNPSLDPRVRTCFALLLGLPSSIRVGEPGGPFATKIRELCAAAPTWMATEVRRVSRLDAEIRKAWTERLARGTGVKRRNGTRQGLVLRSPALPMDLATAARMMEEHEEGFGMDLWRIVRLIESWGAADDEGRARLFAPDAALSLLPATLNVEAVTGVGLQTVSSIVEAPARVDATAAVRTAVALADWAEGRGYLRTAEGFANAAAMCDPASPDGPFRLGQLARGRGAAHVSAMWFEIAEELAFARQDWMRVGLAILGSANLAFARGNFPEARRRQTEALEVAKLHHLTDLEGRAEHDLFSLAFESGDLDDAQAHAERARIAYGPHHHRLPALAYDLAFCWMLRGDFRRAYLILEVILPRFREPRAVLLARSSLARAAGGNGNRRRFEEEWAAVWERRNEPSVQPDVCAALLQLAHGARSLGDVDRAKLAAETAEAVARARGEAQNRFTAETILASLANGTRPVFPAPEPADEAREQVARGFLRTLSVCA